MNPPTSIQLTLAELENNPNLLTQLLMHEQNVSLLLEKRGNAISYTYLKNYNDSTRRLLQEAKAEAEELLKQGYARQEAFRDLKEALQEINTHLP